MCVQEYDCVHVCVHMYHVHTHKIAFYYLSPSFPGGTVGKESACQCKRGKRLEFDPWISKVLWRRKWQPTPVFFPGESHGERSLVGNSSWGHRELDMTEHVHTHIDLSLSPCLTMAFIQEIIITQFSFPYRSLSTRGFVGPHRRSSEGIY